MLLLHIYNDVMALYKMQSTYTTKNTASSLNDCQQVSILSLSLSLLLLLLSSLGEPERNNIALEKADGVNDDNDNDGATVNVEESPLIKSLILHPFGVNISSKTMTAKQRFRLHYYYY